jgi:hypothetical protein
MSHVSMWMVMTLVSICKNEAKLMSLAENVMGIWGHLLWVMGPLTAM